MTPGFLSISESLFSNTRSYLEFNTVFSSFHELLSPLLFGYHLQFRHFPYLPDGPRTMTPFILAVLCVVSSERLIQFSELHTTLGKEVTHLLLTSPAESWQDISTSNLTAADDGEDALDPELGIGPEEIVGACILATFWSDQPSHGVVIASHAFRWARGWIKVSSHATKGRLQLIQYGVDL